MKNMIEKFNFSVLPIWSYMLGYIHFATCCKLVLPGLTLRRREFIFSSLVTKSTIVIVSRKFTVEQIFWLSTDFCQWEKVKTRSNSHIIRLTTNRWSTLYISHVIYDVAELHIMMHHRVGFGWLVKIQAKINLLFYQKILSPIIYRGTQSFVISNL